MKLSVVIPAHNEADGIGTTVARLTEALETARIDYEVLVIDDRSTDGTAAAVEAVASDGDRVRCLPSHYPGGFGFAVRAGLDRFTGDAVAIVMADGSDSPVDLVRYHELLAAGYDCAFGSRFMRGSDVQGYPKFKLLLNRITNLAIRLVFRHGYNDTTNAFKAYRREAVETIQPLLSNHFNLTVEMPLKAIVRGHSYAVVPISWTGRKTGVSKLGLTEMGSRYIFIVLYVLLEHLLSRGDYWRPELRESNPGAPVRRMRLAANTPSHAPSSRVNR